MPQFRLRLNYIDHYLAAPTHFDPPVYKDGARGGNVYPKVPVIRVFGATPSGQKACVHVHGMFPYLYIEYAGASEDEVESHIRRLHLSIDSALGASFRRQPAPNQPSYVAHISLVKGVPFYGYYVGYRLFLKIYLFSPNHIIRLADLLRQGAVLHRPFQPFESHMQYVPQWMCDFNLFGCDYMDCDRLKFRSPVPDVDGVANPTRDRHNENIAPALISDARLQRQSHCALEVDICVWDILNRLEVKPRPCHHVFMETLTTPQFDEKLVTSMAGLWRDETRRRKSRMGLRDHDGTPFPPEALVSVSADPRNSNPGGWIHEDEFRRQVHQQVEIEKTTNNAPAFSVTEQPDELDSAIPTSFESIQDLFPENLRKTILAREMARSASGNTWNEATDVDEKQARSVGQELMTENDDELFHVFQDDIETRESSEGPTAEMPARSPLPPGVRFIGDYTDEEKDLFEVPPGFSSDIVTTIERFAKSKRKVETPERGEKRQKVIHYDSDDGRKDWSSEWAVERPPIDAQPASRTIALGPATTRNQVSLHTPIRIQSSGAASTEPTRRLAKEILTSFGLPDASHLHVFNGNPPRPSDVLTELAHQRLATIVYNEAHYSREKDIPDRSRIYGGQEMKVPGTTIPYLPEFDPSGRPPLPNRKLPKHVQLGVAAVSSTLRTWEISKTPPSRLEVLDWLKKEAQLKRLKSEEQPPTGSQLHQLSQIDAPTPKQKYGFKYSQRKPSKNVTSEAQYMSIMSLEIHVNTRGELLPNPEFDEIVCAFWCLQSEHGGEDLDDTHEQIESGIVIVADPEEQLSHRVRRDGESRIHEESNELDMLNRVIDIVRDLDPDILTGYEVHDSSWGYMIERARRKYEFSLCDELSRIQSDSRGRFGREADRWGFNQTSTIHITGRHVINIWRALRSELDLLQYTMENIAFHVLHRRIPHYSHADLTKWWKNGRPMELSRVLDYWLSRAKISLEILQRNELVARTSEQARLLGVDFYAVFARGSQFKVESLMSRIAKPESLILVSPSRKQVGQQNALECLPMVMEPRSNLYTSPVLVLDFQSLYPSVMIAYNYCYSTFLGRVVPWRGQNKMGFTDYDRTPRLLEALENKINIAPNGIMYSKPEVRKSLLAKMLAEILETRVMVKSGMKLDKDDRQLQRLLNNRQLALKLIANVTYGYTSASFSGRMPCSEIADSIVQTGRETLERSIALIHSVRKWRAEVVYGDTDSLFVLLKGRTRDEAFDIGREIADTITDMNPRPIKLKFEKVYHPCVLLAKKRYVGFKYEHKTQVEPEFDAKGIETVRRDGTPAEQKIEETALKMLFRTADLSQVKEYVQRQFHKIMKGRVSVQDFCFAREVRLGTYSDKGPPPPGALISSRKMQNDPRAEPQYGERVPYVVISGAPGARLIDRCVAPDALLHNDHAELDAEYYITKNIIPPLDRIFSLVGANVRAWYDEMPKVQRIRRGVGVEDQSGPKGQAAAALSVHGKQPTMNTRRTLEAYLQSSTCIVPRCKQTIERGPAKVGWVRNGSGAQSAGTVRDAIAALGSDSAQNISEIPICDFCMAHPASSLWKLRVQLQRAERQALDLRTVCRSCASLAPSDEVSCDSLDCPVYYSRLRAMAELRAANAVGRKGIEFFESRWEDGSEW